MQGEDWGDSWGRAACGRGLQRGKYAIYKNAINAAVTALSSVLPNF